MSIQIYNDTDARAVFIKDSNGSQNMNTLQAILKNPLDTFLSIVDLARDIEIISDVEYDEFIDESSTVYGANATEVVNALNIAFTAAGGNTIAVPVITSSLAINITAGDTINYELTGTNGSEVIWDFSSATGVNVSTENRYKINGGTALTAGTYNIPVLLQNSIGQDSETLVITVASPPYNNTRAVKFNKNDYCDATANTSNPFYRASNGTGSSDAWTVAVWFKGGTSNNKEQTIISYGGNNKASEGHVWLYWDASNNDKQIILRYGTENDYLMFKTPDNGFTTGVYRQIIVTYDGGTTGDDQNDLADYYSRFKIYIDGVSQTLTNSNNNDGWADEIKDEVFRIAEACFGGKHLQKNCLVDEIGLWNSDETANVSLIYNSGTTHDLGLLATPPTNYWMMGDGDTFPTLQDDIGSLDFTMFNMTSSDIVNDVP